MNDQIIPVFTILGLSYNSTSDGDLHVNLLKSAPSNPSVVASFEMGLYIPVSNSKATYSPLLIL
jgi:hypothetical protein